MPSLKGASQRRPAQKSDQPDKIGVKIRGTQAFGRNVVHTDVSTSMQAHHIATTWRQAVPDGGNVVEVDAIENDLIENDVCHRAVAGAK